MKLLYILSEYLPDSGGGIISHYARILPGLVERGHLVKVLVASHGALDRATRVLDGVEVEYLRSSFAERAREGCRKFRNDAFWAFLPLAWGAFHQAKRGEGFDIIEATDWGLLFMPWVVSERKAKVVVSLHGSNGQVDWFSNPEPRGFDGSVVRLAEVAALRLADAIHANSRANAEFWQEKTGRKILVIPPACEGGTKADLTTIERQGGREKEQPVVGPKGEGVGTSESKDTEDIESAAGPCLDKPSGAVFSNPFTSELAWVSENTSPTRSASDPASSLATTYSPPATAPQALKGLVVGRLQNWKGAELLCQALRLVPEIEIEWVGGDTNWGSTGLKASEYLAANYPDVFGKKLHWIGRLESEQVAQKMKVAGFLVVPSLWDVFNLTVAEGLEVRLPVICSRAAGAEMLIENGRSGFLFDPANPEELADSLKFVAGMLEAERLEIGFNAQEAVKTHLNEEKILNLLEGSYRDTIKRGVTTSKDAWLASLLSAGADQVAPPKLTLAQRAIRKVGRILGDV